MIKFKKRNNKLLLFICCLLTLYTAKTRAQCYAGSVTCDGSTCQYDYATISATQDGGSSCAFSISTSCRASNAIGNLGCYIFPTCYGYNYAFELAYEPPGGTSFTALRTECSNTNSHTFSGLSAYGTYKVLDIFAYIVDCGGTNVCYAFEDIATITVTDDVCGIISTLHSGSHPAYVQRTGEIVIDCGIANNTLTSIQSDQDIVFQAGTHLSGHTSANTDVHAYIAACANYSKEAADNTTNVFNTQPLADNVAGINTVSNNKGALVFSIMPNPNNGNFTMHCNNLTVDAMLEMYDVQGKKVYSTILPANTTSLDVNNTGLQNGVYVYKLISQNNILVTNRLVIIN